MPPKIDLDGQRFGRLVVVKDTGKRSPNRKIIYECVCDCGKVVEVIQNSLRTGRTKSCGCLWKETITVHGASKTRLFKIWSGMVRRCNSQLCNTYKNYGAKGVSVCSEWMKFENFQKWSNANGYDDRLSIDRIDPFGNYEPSNCRWASRVQQQRNTRRARYVHINGEKMHLLEVVEKFNLDRSLIDERYEAGLRDEMILSPKQQGVPWMCTT